MTNLLATLVILITTNKGTVMLDGQSYELTVRTTIKSIQAEYQGKTNSMEVARTHEPLCVTPNTNQVFLTATNIIWTNIVYPFQYNRNFQTLENIPWE